ncbi:hypothetical protein HG536_0G01430 [Torulaspora globosa]|uniref:MHD domain-containing protein n=1 Tax=Torulaspora globosa TaxID=48254 RepID=A0A7G3ZL98_9SACH|nr:uncharacterized protein HG536_0G01430 [Torulaspora globosa]QLL34284.1 hypothetical protein HG536_0G01430 [Torulaspora globosa]
MSSCIFIVDENLEPLVSKNIKAVPNLQGILRLFKSAYKTQSAPVISAANFHFVHVKRDSLVFLAAIHTYDAGANIMSISTFLDQFHFLLKKYLGVQSLDRNMVLDNVLLVMELIDETLDFGIVQVTDASIMKDYIRVKVNLPDDKIIEGLPDDDDDNDDNDDEDRQGKNVDKSKSGEVSGKPNLYSFLQQTKRKTFSGKSSISGGSAQKSDDQNEEVYNSYIARTTIMPVSWRAKGIHYGKNEFFLDVVEQVQYLMDFESKIIKKNLIHGKICCKSYLSGMPKLTIALNKLSQQDDQFLSHTKFHECVSLEALNEKSIQFIPPDGDFVLCQYELKRHVRDQPMLKLVSFNVKPKLQKFKIQVSLSIETHFKARNTTSKLSLKLPLSRLFQEYQIDLSKPARFKSDSGKVLFNLSDDFLLWEIDSMRGGHGETQLSMTAEFSLFNKKQYDEEQQALRHSMNPPPLREGPKLEELYDQVHRESVKSNLASRLLTINFEIPYCACSGLQVEYLKIVEDQLQYQSFPWVRYKTISDEEYGYFI